MTTKDQRSEYEVRAGGPRIGSVDERVTAAIQEDGSLFNGGWYLEWSKGESTATLDGSFTAQQLRAIADHMDKTSERNT